MSSTPNNLQILLNCTRKILTWKRIMTIGLAIHEKRKQALEALYKMRDYNVKSM